MFEKDPKYLQAFVKLDDYDIWSCVKIWTHHSDKVLSNICQLLLDRKLFKIQFQDEPFSEEQLKNFEEKLMEQNIPQNLHKYFLITGVSSNAAYISSKQGILIKMKDGSVRDIADASDLPTIKALSNIVRKYYVCWSKHLTLQPL